MHLSHRLRLNILCANHTGSISASSIAATAVERGSISILWALHQTPQVQALHAQAKEIAPATCACGLLTRVRFVDDRLECQLLLTKEHA